MKNQAPVQLLVLAATLLLLAPVATAAPSTTTLVGWFTD